MAWSSGETGRREVYVEPFGRPGSRVQVSLGGGRSPAWSRDGRSLYYVREHTLFEATVRVGTTFACDTPTPVFTANAEIAAYEATPDGQKFLVLRSPPPDFLPFNVIVNWAAKIR